MRQKIQLKTMLLIAGLILALGIAGASIGSRNNNKQTSMTPTTSQSDPENSETKKTEYLSYQGEDGKTALELLKSEAEVETKSSSLGEYVVSINGNDGGGSKYWLFYVDGRESPVGAGSYTTKSGETIEWKLQ